MPSATPTVGVDDLQTLFPAIAAEADGWDPTTGKGQSAKDKQWKCPRGHRYSAKVYNRTKQGSGCPYCSGNKVLAGFNDLATVHPELAAEAEGWDPSTVTRGSTSEKKRWRCPKGHPPYLAYVAARTSGEGCPVCGRKTLIVGVNDLKTLHPEIAAEADGWDPTTVMPGSSSTKRLWVCPSGHPSYLAHPKERTGKDRTGCPICSGNKLLVGFNDLATVRPDLAAEADGWDPTTVMAGSSAAKKMWVCPEGHPSYPAFPNARSRGEGCPVCGGKKIIVGVNDLKTLHPEIAAEADGWDPTTVMPSAHSIKSWKCPEGHSYSMHVYSRTGSASRGCPVCAGRQVLVGFNDLATLYPEIAAEADGWDPTTVTPGSSSEPKMWRCPEYSHSYKAIVASRVYGSGCPICAGQVVLAGFNDLATLHPEIAAEADGWDPSTVTAKASSKIKKWRCKEGHTWEARVADRTPPRPTGCPDCCVYGYSPSEQGWFYLMARPGEQQIGITNDLVQRVKTHERDGWQLIDNAGPARGDLVAATELLVKRWLRKEVGVISGTSENWSAAILHVRSLSELKRKSGIQTDLF